MQDNDQTAQAIAREKGNQRFSSSRRTNEDEKSVSRYTFFIIGLISFFAGSWAIICLLNALSTDGVVPLAKQLISALISK